MKLNRSIILLSTGLLLAACHDDNTVAIADGQEVPLKLSINVMEMQQADGGGQTRSESDAMDITFGADPTTRSNKNPDETAIKSLYLVQFNGTAARSTVVKSGNIVRNATDSTAMFDFAPVNATCRVYVVANFDPDVANGTSLGSFERMMATHHPATSVVATGLPMCGYVDFNPAATANTPQVYLKAMVAKLTVTYTVDRAALADFKPGTAVSSLNIKLRNVTNGTAYGVTTDFTTVWHPTDVTFADVTVGETGTTYTYYVPENIAGNGSDNITNWSRRSIANAPANALYFEVTGRNRADDGTVVIASYIGNPADPKTFNICRNYAYTLTASIKNANTIDERITVQPDYFDLNESLGNRTANCYIITANNSSMVYFFDATKRGNNATTVAGIHYNLLPSLRTATEARVIWQTDGPTSVIKSVKYEHGGRVCFTMGTATEGNAVIGIFASSADNAPCLWSWHIWKLNGSAPDNVLCTKISASTGEDANFFMMDRNLGAYNNRPGDVGAIGLQYQWGRKDPFPGPAGFNSTEPTNIYGRWNNGGVTGSWTGQCHVQTVAFNIGGTEAWAVQYPTIFIINPSTGDWMVPKNDALWGTPWTGSGTGDYNLNPGTKSIYDPCPVGYRVPPQDTWSKQVTNGSYVTNGVILDDFQPYFWFPAPGIRDRNTGVLTAFNRGFYWSSSIHSTGRVSFLYFNDGGGTNPQQPEDSAQGFPVRCVSESIL